MSNSKLYPLSKFKKEQEQNRIELEKNIGRINSQVGTCIEFIYQEMKLVQSGEVSVSRIKQQFFDDFKKINILFKNEDIPKLKNAIDKTIKEFNSGLFEDYGYSRGVLKTKYSGIVNALEIRIKAIVEQSLLSVYYYLEVSQNSFMELDTTSIVLASKNKDMLESLARKMEMVEHETNATVYSVRSTSHSMIHNSHFDWNFSFSEDKFLGESDSFLEMQVNKMKKDSYECSNLYITEVRFVTELTKEEQKQLLIEVNPCIQNPHDYIIGVKRKKKAIESGKYFEKNAAESFDFYKNMDIRLKDQQVEVFY